MTEVANMRATGEDVVGLDISNGVISAARVTAAPGGTLTLQSAGWTEVSPDASERELAAALRHVWRSAGIPSWTVCASLRSRSVIVRYFSYPALEQVELVSALALEAEDSLQLPRDQIVFDWHLNHRQRRAAEGKAVRDEGLLVAAPRREVDQQMAMLRRAGLYPVAIDLGATAVGNLFQVMHPDPKSHEDTCVLHLTSQSANIVLLFEGDSLYARTIYARGDTWDASLGSLLEGLQDALKFYVFKLRGQPVRRVAVSGRLPDKADILRLLREKAGVPVEIWDPLTRVAPGSARVSRLLRESERPPLAVSMGLALRRYDGD